MASNPHLLGLDLRNLASPLPFYSANMGFPAAAAEVVAVAVAVVEVAARVVAAAPAGAVAEDFWEY